MKLEVSNLTRIVEEGTGFNLEEESTISELIKRKDELIKERDTQTDLIIQLRNQVKPQQQSAPSYWTGFVGSGTSREAQTDGAREGEFG